MVAAMSLPSILFIPDQFGDYRLWSDIPDRLQGRAQAIHFDQHDLPWMSANGEFLDEARQMAPGGAFHIVAANGGAARFGFALAEAGLARGLVLFQPSLDSLPDDVHLDRPAEVAPDHVLDPYMPVLSALDEPDPGRAARSCWKSSAPPPGRTWSRPGLSCCWPCTAITLTRFSPSCRPSQPGAIRQRPPSRPALTNLLSCHRGWNSP
jgi:hypothetical protein